MVAGTLSACWCPPHLLPHQDGCHARVLAGFLLVLGCSGLAVRGTRRRQCQGEINTHGPCREVATGGSGGCKWMAFGLRRRLWRDAGPRGLAGRAGPWEGWQVWQLQEVRIWMRIRSAAAHHRRRHSALRFRLGCHQRRQPRRLFLDLSVCKGGAGGVGGRNAAGMRPGAEGTT